MARQANRLTARSVASIKAPGRHADGNNLYLSVSTAGAKSWVFFYTLAGRQREMGIGPARDVSLAQARDLAAQHRRSILAGIDPLEARERAKAAPSSTFGEVATQFISDHEGTWRNAAHRRQWRQTLEDHAANLWSLPVAEVSTEHVLAALRPIWLAMPETASRLRGRIERILGAAKARGLREGPNPAMWKDHLENLLPRAAKLQRGHHPAMSYAEVPEFYAELCCRIAPAAIALRFIILTAARSGEVRGMRWSEVDLDDALWIVTAARMKGKRVHRFTLSAPAVDLLRGLTPGEGEDLVFPSASGREMSDMVFGALLKRMGRSCATAHGFRSSFRDWVHAETEFPAELAEEALAHLVGSEVERAYRRGDALNKRRQLMNVWAAFVTSAEHGSKVVKLSTAQPVTA